MNNNNTDLQTQIATLRDTVAAAMPENLNLVDSYVKTGLEGCTGCFDSDEDMLDDFLVYVDYVKSGEY